LPVAVNVPADCEQANAPNTSGRTTNLVFILLL